VKRPSFQFYPGDWKRNPNLRRCSEAARGAWADILCVLHDSDEYGVVRWPLKELIQVAGVKPKSARELVEKRVLKGADANAPDYVWAPTHAGKKGTPVTLVEAGEGPCWYSSRMVRDEHIRQRRGQGTRFGDEDGPSPHSTTRTLKAPPKTQPKAGIGDGLGDGPSSSSSSSSSSDTSPHTDFQNPGASESARAQRPEVMAVLLMRQAGCVTVNAEHPDLIDAIAEGVTPEALGETAREVIAGGHDARRAFAYAIGTALGRHRERARNRPNGATHAAAHTPGSGASREGAADRAERVCGELDAAFDRDVDLHA